MASPTSFRSVAGEVSTPYIDCDACVREIYARIRRHRQGRSAQCPLCRYFAEKLGDRDGSESDARLLLHSQMNLVFELFERFEDDEGQDLLQRVEDDCC